MLVELSETLRTLMSLECLNCASLLWIIISTSSVWLLWRLWRFSIQPWLHPEDPPELPYLIPGLGHFFLFFTSSETLIKKARQYFRDTTAPLALTVAGQTIYVVTDPKDVFIAYSNNATLSFQQFVEQMMRTFNISKRGIKLMYKPPSEIQGRREGFPNPSDRPLGTLSRSLHTTQLYPGANLVALEQSFKQYFRRRLDISPDRLDRNYMKPGEKDTITVPLLQWVSDIFVSAGQEGYFGPELGAIAPDFVFDFLEFDSYTWQVLYHYPRIFSGKMNRAKDTMIASLNAYFTLDETERKSSAWFTKAAEDEMKLLGLDRKDISAMMLIIYWGINTNTRKICFWLLVFLLQDPALLSTIRTETAQAFHSNTSSDPDLTFINKQCPQLSAAFDEALRHCAYSASARLINSDTVIGGRTLKAGRRMLIPFRELHFDTKAWGDDAHVFRPARFLENEKLTRSSSWRPFGGGGTLCPGRHIAKHTTMCFVAMLLRRFEVDVMSCQTKPQLETGRPVLGVADAKSGYGDYYVNLRPKK